MNKIVELLEKYDKPKSNIVMMVLLGLLLISQYNLWGCVSEVRDEQLKRTVVIDTMKHNMTTH